MRNANFETADEDFLDRYGPDILAVVQPRSKAAEHDTTTKQGAQWVIEHYRTLPYPTPTGSSPPPPTTRRTDYRLYEKQLRRRRPGPVGPGVGAADEPDQRRHPVVQAERSNSRRTPKKAAFLADVRRRLYDEYPGWGDTSGLPRRPELDVMMRNYRAPSTTRRSVTPTPSRRSPCIWTRRRVIDWAESEGLVERAAVHVERRRRRPCGVA